MKANSEDPDHTPRSGSVLLFAYMYIPQKGSQAIM